MQQKHHVTYKIKYEQHETIKEKAIVARLLSDALANFLKECIEEDDTGIFFELSNADLDFFKNKPSLIFYFNLESFRFTFYF